MMRKIFDFLVGKPGRLTAIGSFVGHVGWLFLIAGLFGNMPGMLIDAITHDGVKSLSELFPQLPLWWVPESPFAVFLSLLATSGGAYIWVLGRRVDRLYLSHIE